MHLELCQKHGLSGDNHKVGVMENDDVKILWDFNIYTDHLIVNRKPDIVAVNKKTLFAMLSLVMNHRVYSKRD